MKTYLLVTALFIALGGLVFSLVPKQAVHAENERIVTIYADGQERIVATDAKTVGDVLKRAQITVHKHDAVEPGQDTQLIAPNYSINVYRARPVTVIDGQQRFRIMSPYQSAKKIAQTAGLTVYDEDVLEVDRINNFLAENGVGLKLTITRSVPLNMVLYGKQIAARTQAKTVSGLLQEKRITLGPEDGVSPAGNTPIVAGMNVAVYRNGVQTVNEEQEVAFPIEQIKDADREVGYREIKEAGTKGKRLVTFQIELRDGKEVSRKEIQSVITLQPKKQVEVIGVKRKAFSGSLEEAFARLRQCESGGNYANKRNPSYRGAYQFGYTTWANYGGYYDPADAPPAVQDQKAYETYMRRGWQPWPACSQKLGLY